MYTYNVFGQIRAAKDTYMFRNSFCIKYHTPFSALKKYSFIVGYTKTWQNIPLNYTLPHFQYLIKQHEILVSLILRRQNLLLNYI